MKGLLLILGILGFITQASAEVAVKDRCGDRDVLVAVFELMDKNYPPRDADVPAISFDAESIFTISYDGNLDRVTCGAKFLLYPDRVDGNKSAWAAGISKMALKFKSMPKLLRYDMQYVSGSTDTFNVGLRQIDDDTGQSQFTGKGGANGKR